MASPYEVEVKFSTASNLKNVNWRNGANRPYAVVWVDPTQKRSTNVDDFGDTHAHWDEKLTIPLPPEAKVEDSTLFVDIIHASSESDAKPLIIGSAKLRLIEVGVGERISRTLKLTRPSGRPQGTVDVRVLIKDTGYRAPPRAHDIPTYGVKYSAQPLNVGYGAPVSASSPSLSPVSYVPQVGYEYGQQSYGYGQPVQQSYGCGQPSYGYGQGVQTTVNVVAPEKKNKLGFGAGLAMGAVAGGIGALALEKGIDSLEDKIADRAVEKFDEDFYDF